MRCSRRYLAYLLLPVLAPLLGLSGCTPSVIHGGFESPMPAARLYAIERAVREGDTAQVRHIIEQLESDDPAVRMSAISALERLTHRNYGYRHDDPLLERRSAIGRWREAYESGELADVLGGDGRASSRDLRHCLGWGSGGASHG